MAKTRYLLFTALAAAACGSLVGSAAGTTDEVVSRGAIEPDAPTMLGSVGISSADMQAASRTASGTQLYVGKHDGIVCVTDVTGGGHCAPEDGLGEGLGFGGELCQADIPADTARITALVPEGVRAVDLLTGEGQVASSPVVRQTVSFELPRKTVATVRRALLRSDTGVREVRVPAPPIADDAPCGLSYGH